MNNRRMYRRTKNEMHTVDFETGEVEVSITNKVTSIPREDNFFKMYEAAYEILPYTGKETKLSVILASMMDYRNVVTIPKDVKDKIADKMDIKDGPKSVKSKIISNYVLRLVKYGVLIKLGMGVFFVNPFLFSKGSWSDILALREDWKNKTRLRITGPNPKLNE